MWLRKFRSVFLLSGVALVLAGCASSKQPAGPRITPVAAIPRTDTRPVTGLPAIRPSSAAGVTLDELRAYASSHAVPHSLSRAKPTVMQVGIVSAERLSHALAGEPFGVAGESRLAV